MKGSIIVSACLFLATICSCTTPPRPFDGPWEARAILDRSVQAYGGPEKVLDFEEMAVECAIQLRRGFKVIVGHTRFEWNRPEDRVLMALRLEGGEEQVVFRDHGTQGERMDGRETGRDVGADIDRKLRAVGMHAFLLEDGAKHATLEPPVVLFDVPCALLTRRSGDETWRVWIDSEAFLIRKIQLDLPPDRDPPRTVEWIFTDFSSRQGRMVPGSFKILLDGDFFQEGRVTDFRLNSGGARRDD